MKLDDALKEAFEREIGAVPERRPSVAEASRACGGCGRRSGLGRVARLGNFAPLLALAAASVVALCLGTESVRLTRPLAAELAATIPDDAGSRFLDFMLEAGESYRSVD